MEQHDDLYVEPKKTIMSQPFSFEVKIQKACGIDMHKDNIKSCYLGVDHRAVIQDFGTTTMQLRKFISSKSSKLALGRPDHASSNKMDLKICIGVLFPDHDHAEILSIALFSI